MVRCTQIRIKSERQFGRRFPRFAEKTPNVVSPIPLSLSAALMEKVFSLPMSENTFELVGEDIIAHVFHRAPADDDTAEG